MYATAEELELPFASLEYQEKKKETFTEKFQRLLNLHLKYEGLFTPGQCQFILGISQQRFSQIKDRLEAVPVEIMGGKEYYTGLSLIKYREEAVEKFKK